MRCKQCGSDIRTTTTGSHRICASLFCQLIHDKEGRPKGWAIGAGSVPGDLLPYGDVLSLWEAAGQAPADLKIMHVAAIVEIAMQLVLKYHKPTLAAALNVVLEK